MSQYFDNDKNIKSEKRLIKFNFNNKDYLVYFIDENEENKQIFVSRLILNSEGKYFIDNIILEIMFLTLMKRR